MPHFVYLGDHPRVVVYGLPFGGDEPTEVNDEMMVRKLRGNREFSEIYGRSDTEPGVEVLDALPVQDQPKRRGRPPKAR
jgi:hypothetical protein